MRRYVTVILEIWYRYMLGGCRNNANVNFSSQSSFLHFKSCE
jgi:hypothetical protein